MNPELLPPALRSTLQEHRRTGRPRGLRCAVAGLAILAMSACGSSPATPTPDATASTGSGSLVATADQALDVQEAWAAARPTLEPMAMTAVFATLRNTTDRELSIVSAATDASARTELHTTVATTGKGATPTHLPSAQSMPAQTMPAQTMPPGTMMQPVERFTIPAHGTLTLAPGGDHIMVMAMTRPLTGGTPVIVTLSLADGSRVRFEAVAKPFTGANEPYHSDRSAAAPSASMGRMSSRP